MCTCGLPSLGTKSSHEGIPVCGHSNFCFPLERERRKNNKNENDHNSNDFNNKHNEWAGLREESIAVRLWSGCADHILSSVFQKAGRMEGSHIY